MGAVAAGELARRGCVVVDHHPALHYFLRRFLAARGFVVVAECRTGAAGIDAIALHRPSLAVVDLHLPDCSGVDVATSCADGPTSILIYTASAEPQEVADAVSAGVGGFVLKGAPLADLDAAIDRAGTRNSYLDATLAHRLLHGDPGKLDLTRRERQVLTLLAAGDRYGGTAAKLGICEETVSSHVKDARRRLSAATTPQAVAIAIRHALIA